MPLPNPPTPTSKSPPSTAHPSTTTSSPSIRLQGPDLLTRQSFHSTFSQKLGFPSYYGNNMDAWIDIMSSGESEVSIGGEDGTLTLIIEDAGVFRGCKMGKALVECVEFINVRRAGYEMLKVVFE
jgi:hypothetical protein